eukprot:scaffold19366_cov71-Phaeocystis_antarctica.AAC.6
MSNVSPGRSKKRPAPEKNGGAVVGSGASLPTVSERANELAAASRRAISPLLARASLVSPRDAAATTTSAAATTEMRSSRATLAGIVGWRWTGGRNSK